MDLKSINIFKQLHLVEILILSHPLHSTTHYCHFLFNYSLLSYLFIQPHFIITSYSYNNTLLSRLFYSTTYHIFSIQPPHDHHLFFQPYKYNPYTFHLFSHSTLIYHSSNSYFSCSFFSLPMLFFFSSYFFCNDIVI